MEDALKVAWFQVAQAEKSASWTMEKFKVMGSYHAWLALTMVDSFANNFDKYQSQVLRLFPWTDFSELNVVM